MVKHKATMLHSNTAAPALPGTSIRWPEPTIQDTAEPLKIDRGCGVDVAIVHNQTGGPTGGAICVEPARYQLHQPINHQGGG